MGKTRPKPSNKPAIKRNGGTLYPGDHGQGKLGGRPPTRLFRAALLEVGTDADRLAIAKKLISDAKKGKPHAVKEYADRIEGKSQQNIDVTSDGQPIVSLFDVVVNKKEKEE